MHVVIPRPDVFPVMIAEARAQAKALDAEFASTGRLRGPLHGVPVSFKDVCEWLGKRGRQGWFPG